MSFQIIPADQSIMKKVKLIMLDPAPIDGWPVAAGSGGVEIPLQFPPRIKSTSKSGNFEEIKESGAYEPVAVWMGSSGTNLSVELDYVITGTKSNNIVWDAAGVATAVHTVMAYFYRDVQTGTKGGGQSASGGAGVPILQAILYQVAPEASELSTWRMMDANVSYSEELIIVGDKVYPQKATITLNLMMYTRINDRNKKEKQKVAPAAEKPRKEWY